MWLARPPSPTMHRSPPTRSRRSRKPRRATRRTSWRTRDKAVHVASSSIRRTHPVRTLISFLVILTGLYVLMGLSHTWTPRLGLDLQGGTTITLTAKNSTGTGAVDQASLELAKTIIQQRVDSLGVGESEVTTSGGNQIQVSVPNMQKDALVQLVGQTAQLEFRAVYQVESTTNSPATDQATALPAVPALSSARPTAVTSPLPSADSARKALLLSLIHI